MRSPFGKLMTPIRALASKSRRRWVASAAVLGLSAMLAAQADAGLSKIGKSNGRNEANQEQILEHVYGGDFVKTGDNFSNGSITATRLDDSSDTIWTKDLTSARAVASFAQKTQSFGFFSGSAGGSYNDLFDVSGKGFNVSGGSSDLSGLGSEYRLARAGQKKSKPIFTSLDTDNTHGKDHLVTYALSGAGNDGKYLLFWEDSNRKKADFDFNDLVIEASTSGSSAVLIPLPAAAWSGLSGLIGLGMLAGYRKVRRHLS